MFASASCLRIPTYVGMTQWRVGASVTPDVRLGVVLRRPTYVHWHVLSGFLSKYTAEIAEIAEVENQ